MPWLRKRNDVQEMLAPIHLFATEPTKMINTDLLIFCGDLIVYLHVLIGWLMDAKMASILIKDVVMKNNFLYT